MSEDNRSGGYEYPAEFMVFWPDQEVMVCEEHAHQLRVLNDVLGGAVLASRPLIMLGQSGECKNCVNEAKS